jgi:DinB superfamily
MNAKDVIQTSLKSTGDMLTQFVADLSDEDLLVRPAPNANHIAWQLGHLIACEAMMGDVVPRATYPELPGHLKSQMAGKSSKTPPPGGYLKKAEYVDWFNKIRSATIANVDRLSDADLDKATPGDFAAWAPTMGALLVLTANHTLMHAGQFSVVRRLLNKPVLF